MITIVVGGGGDGAIATWFYEKEVFKKYPKTSMMSAFCLLLFLCLIDVDRFRGSGMSATKF